MYGKLYVVATPIGNLADFSFRAVDILKQVDLIAAEDTRHVKMLLQHYGINKPLQSLHQHNEEHASQGLVDKIRDGQSVALVSDAGTPMISDPGFPLVKLARQQGVDVCPIPGACALIAALSVGGLPTSRFSFEGFLPRTGSARRSFFESKLPDVSTWAFYESSHRIQAALEDMLTVFPANHQIVVAREITKLHETIVGDELGKVLEKVRSDENMRKGEFVVLVAGLEPGDQDDELSDEQRRILGILLTKCSTKTAAALAAEITGQRKKTLYQAALAMQDKR
ncbi:MULTISPECIES: 16S rRNA (cytidine(1402)-2'-O)-methyltransferase [Methylomonas]|uniref:Ribosomal RNA small subunit methyltransferase I n=2 Tax=Methylomonas TaxID=416 RepID=A0A126T4B3_9GAMM|nr:MULTISPECIES: 16S rRNA (cytidine(1402)-2'-O)-methyltransferase [Methylomonas]AMK76902.1 methyltransferase [Methylomonas denitrificans]OAI09131.1 rRNA (cytidine-2'-O-)-methyltransferase [Methylomonas methanica]TCV74208.1 16S rRNA (cytidine1402-2'-O)-methyltransferase [Methylomonas methanica]